MSAPVSRDHRLDNNDDLFSYLPFRAGICDRDHISLNSYNNNSANKIVSTDGAGSLPAGTTQFDNNFNYNRVIYNAPGYARTVDKWCQPKTPPPLTQVFGQGCHLKSEGDQLNTVAECFLRYGENETGGSIAKNSYISFMGESSRKVEQYYNRSVHNYITGDNIQHTQDDYSRISGKEISLISREGSRGYAGTVVVSTEASEGTAGFEGYAPFSTENNINLLAEKNINSYSDNNINEECPELITMKSRTIIEEGEEEIVLNCDQKVILNGTKISIRGNIIEMHGVVKIIGPLLVKGGIKSEKPIIAPAFVLGHPIVCHNKETFATIDGKDIAAARESGDAKEPTVHSTKGYDEMPDVDKAVYEEIWHIDQSSPRYSGGGREYDPRHRPQF